MTTPLLACLMLLGGLVLGWKAHALVTLQELDAKRWVEYGLSVIGRLPSTNVKLVAAIYATQLVILGTLVLLALGKEIDEGVLTVLACLAGGVDFIALKQFAKKRETHRADAPQAPESGA